MFTHKIIRGWESGGSRLTKTETLTGSGENNVDQPVDADETDLLISFAVLIAQMKSIYILATKNMVITPHDQSDSPLAQIDIVANVPFEWTSTSGQDNPFEDNVGSLHVANEASAEGTLSIRCLYDSTPETTS